MKAEGSETKGDEVISGLTCTNYNRVLSSTCTISQSYDTTTTTTTTISKGNTSTDSYSWGRTGTESSSITWGKSAKITLGNSVMIGAGGATGKFEQTFKTEVELGANRQETIASSESSNEQNTESTGTSQTDAHSWQSTETRSITCEGSMDVPPSHSISYDLSFNAINATVQEMANLKLTFCSSLMNGRVGDEMVEGEDYKMVYGIPMSIVHKESTGCDVLFNPAESLSNAVTCAEEEKLIAAGAGSLNGYVPRCQTADTDLYDGCQCDLGDTRFLGVCWCVDTKGNAKPSQMKQFGDEYSWEEVCVNVLGCEDSAVEIPVAADAAKMAEDAEKAEMTVDVKKVSPEEVALIESAYASLSLIDSLVRVAIASLVIVVSVYVIGKCSQCVSTWRSTPNEHKYGALKVSEMTEDEALV